MVTSDAERVKKNKDTQEDAKEIPEASNEIADGSIQRGRDKRCVLDHW